MKRLTAFRFIPEGVRGFFPGLRGSCWCEGRCLSGQRERTVTPSAYAFSGSNPLLPTIFSRLEIQVFLGAELERF